MIKLIDNIRTLWQVFRPRESGSVTLKLLQLSLLNGMSNLTVDCPLLKPNSKNLRP